MKRSQAAAPPAMQLGLLRVCAASVALALLSAPLRVFFAQVPAAALMLMPVLPVLIAAEAGAADAAGSRSQGFCNAHAGGLVRAAQWA